MLLPTLWVCMLAFILSDEQSICSAQVESRSRCLPQRGYVLQPRVGRASGLPWV
jgi:hypothetical protein